MASFMDYAVDVATSAKAMNDILKKHNLPLPSFEVDGPARMPDGPEFKELQMTRMALVDAATAVLHMAIGPEDYLKWQSFMLKHDGFALRALAHYDVFNAVPTDGEISYADLAAKVGVDKNQLKRIIRQGMTNYIFKESRPGYIVHTATSLVPVNSPSIKAWMLHNGDDVTNASVKMVDAMDKYGASEDPAHCGFGVAFGLDTLPADSTIKSAFDFMEHDGEGENKGWRVRRVGGAMESMKNSAPHHISHVHRGYDWDSLGKAQVVDCGGSVGFMSFELAKEHSNLHCVIQDFAALESQFLALRPADLAERVTFEAHDIFTPNPIIGADVYFFRFIFHDWPDSRCVQLLNSVIPAMRSNSRIIIADAIVDRWEDVKSKAMDRLVTSLDLQVWGMINAKERSEEDWLDLFSKAEKKLKAVAFNKPEGSATGFIEITLDEQ